MQHTTHPSLILPRRFNGPATSANGGYACGAVAAYLGTDALVRLQSPPALDVPLTVRETEEGVEVLDDEEVVARGRVQAPTIEVPPAPSIDAAHEARARYAGHQHHALPHCFVCGVTRPAHDGLELFTGPVEGCDLVAADWVVPNEFVERGVIDPKIVWAALDCPSYFGLRLPGDGLALLGQMCAHVPDDVPGDRRYVAYGWRVGHERRKHFSGSALADETGKVWAYAEHVWISLVR